MSIDKQRKLGSFASSKKGVTCIPSAFNIKQAYRLGRSQTRHITVLGTCLKENMNLCENKRCGNHIKAGVFNVIIQDIAVPGIND